MKTGATFSDNRPSVATIGFFDGVHRGHRYLIEQVRQAARERGLAATAVTFPVHPRRVMQPDFPLQLLTTRDEKLALLSDTGLDYCLMLPFTPQLASLSARDFMELLCRDHAIRTLVIGHDHRFGHNRSEGFDDYVRHGRELGMEVLPAQAYSYRQADGQLRTVSSSVIRKLLLQGEVEEAASGLGYDYFLEGTVVDGYHVGRTIGFPTANLHVTDADKLLPADGVYAVRVMLDGKTYKGMSSIGLRPTLDNGSQRSIETYIFDFHGNIYEQPMRLSFVRRTRGEIKFPSVAQLAEQLHRDEEEIRAILHAKG